MNINLTVEYTSNRILVKWSSKELDTLFKENKRSVSLVYHCTVELNDYIVGSTVIGFMLPIVSKSFSKDKINVQINLPISQTIVRQWCLYRDINNVKVQGTGVYKKIIPKSFNKKRICLLYGGGKDSLAALKIFAQNHPDAEIFISRIHWSVQSQQKHKQIFENVVLAELIKIFPSLRYCSVSTDIYSNVKDVKTARLMNMAFYHSISLPITYSVNPDILNHSYDALEFSTNKGLRYKSARPESDLMMTELLRQSGLQTRVRNISFAIPGYLHLDILAEGNDDFLNAIYMCEDTRERWCHKCRKCFTFFIFCLYKNLNQSEFGISATRLASRYGILAKVTQQIQSLPRGDYVPLASYEMHHSSLGHLMKQVDISSLAFSNDVIDMIKTIKNHYSECESDDSMSIWENAALLESGGDEDYLEYYKSLGLEICRELEITLQNKTLQKYSF
uniref:hypothetical protein n=1 Tax=Ningiella ruwaisensis TaxID=2364274 RepID=UPI0010A0BE04|nr:hypothetical protein [Ningiella ruwaisensis]